jgi:drug/metabolite transporter (DMT)-like permease
MSPSNPAHTHAENLRGIAAMLASSAMFIVNDALFKLAAQSLPTGEAIFLRGAFTTLLCAALVAAWHDLSSLPRRASTRLLGRAAAEVGSTILFLTALVNMPIGDAVAILQFTPLAITAGAALFLGESVGWRRWLATGVGLVGVLIIMRPGSAAFNPFALLVVLSIVFGAARDLVTRGMGAGLPTFLIAGTSSAAVTLASLGLAAIETWTWPAPGAVAILLGSAAALTAGQYWLIVSVRTGEIAVVAPFRYSVILWALLAGFLVWREVPDAASWTGIAIVTAAGLYTFLRQQRLRRITRP